MGFEFINANQVTQGFFSQRTIPHAADIPSAIARAKGLGLIQDDTLLGQLVDEVIADEPALVAKYKSGKTQVLAALVGAVMKKSHGKFLPQKVSELLVAKLSG